jgi:integrase
VVDCTGLENRQRFATFVSSNLTASAKTPFHGVFFVPSPPIKIIFPMSLTACMRRMRMMAVPHGFRSTLTDWVAERTAYPAEVREMALAHAVGDKTEAAYRRGDLFDKRRKLMQEWSKFVWTSPGTGANVVPIRSVT